MLKKSIGIIAILIMGVTVWYFGFKTYDYEFTFTGNLAPIGACHFVKTYEARIHGKTITFEQDSTLTQLQYERVIGEVPYHMDWNFTRVSDTISKLTLGITAQNSSIGNRFQLLFGGVEEITTVKEELIALRKQLHEFTDTFTLEINGQDTLPATKAYAVTIQSNRVEKAKAMIKKNTQLSSWIKKQNVPTNGYPYTQIKRWDKPDDTITFEYGFPIVPNDSTATALQHPQIKYTQIPNQSALKATYHGNYINSDQAWFAIIAYAKANAIDVNTTVVEFFYDNPMEGGDDRKWKAEILIPLVAP